MADAKHDSRPDGDDVGDSANPPRSDRKLAATIATVVAVPATIAAAVGIYALISPEAADDPDSGVREAPSESVSLEIPELSEDEFEVCRALVTEVPETLGDLEQRATTGAAGAAEISAAWGEPPVSLRCGVAAVDVPLNADVYRLGKTCWYAVEGEAGVAWTTVDRKVPVEVTTPDDYEGPGQLVQGLSEAVDEKAPPADAEDVPSGCGWGK
ncbi:MAG: DUF3515 family protein [Stackebrandtia sp.]